MKDKLYRNSDKSIRLLMIDLIIEIVSLAGICVDINTLKYWFLIKVRMTILGILY